VNNPNGKYPIYGSSGIFGYADKYLAKEGSTIVGRKGNINSPIYVTTKFWNVDTAFALTPNSNINGKFLFYFCKGFNFHALDKSTTIPSLAKTDLLKIDVSLPSLEGQHAIVSKIEELLSELDKGKQQLETAQQQLKIYRQAVLKWAFEGKLTNKDVKEGELPEGWVWVKTIDVINTINNGYTPTKEFLTQDTGEIPFLKVYNLNFDGTLNFKKNPTFIPNAIHKKDLKRSVCYPGDVLINIVGPPLGKVSVVTDQFPEWNINQAIVMFRPNAKVSSKYLSYFLQNKVTINWLENTSKATAGQWNIKVTTCREIPFPICSKEEQRLIVQEIESRLSVCDKIEETITTNLAQSETLRQSILKKAFEGKLV
ncbi:MAG: restriction endonuclease subunit S, partial [Cyclobacteriaceae bacterium]